MIEQDVCGDSKIDIMVSSSVLTWHVNDPFPGRLSEQFCINQKILESAIENKYSTPFLIAAMSYLIERVAIIDAMEDSVTNALHLTMSAQQKRALQKLEG